MSSSKKSTTNTSQTATTTPNVPDWLLQPAQGLGAGLQNLIGQGAGNFTPSVSDLENKGFTDASGLTPSNNYTEGSNMVRGTNFAFDPGSVTGESSLTGLQKYMNPYKDQVINPVLNDFDVQAGKTRAAQAASGAVNGAFRGDRFALREGATEGELARGRASTEGGLLNNMYTQALSASDADAARRQAAATGNAERSLTAQTAGTADRLQGAGLLGNLGTAQDASGRANVALEGALGSRATDLMNTIKSWPIQYQQQLEGLFTGLDPSLFTGQTINGTSTSTTKNSNSLGGLFGDLLLAGASGAGKAMAAGGG